jgi:Tfp pilus assembly protein FimT
MNNNSLNLKKNFHTQAGFTIIEIVIVLGVIVIISGLGLANFQSSNNSSSTYSASRDILTSDLRVAADKALNSERFQGQEPTGWGVQISEGTNSYTIFADLNGNRAYDGNEKFKTVKLNSDLKVYPVYGSTTAGPIVFNAGDAKTYFNNNELLVNSTDNLLVYLLNKNDAVVKVIEITSLGTVSSINSAPVIGTTGSTVLDIVQPDEVAGLVTWYKADALTTLNNGDPVNSWTDSSVNGNNLIYVSKGKPAYVTNGVNSLPVVRFDGDDDYLACTSTVGNAKTIFVVMKWLDPNKDYAPFLGKAWTNVPDLNTWPDMWSGAGSQDPEPPLPPALPGQAIGVGSGLSKQHVTNAAVYNNGTSVSAGTLMRDKVNFQIITMVPTADMYFDIIGANYIISPLYHTHADYAEVIVYSSVLTEENRKGIELYLSDKYNIPLSY